MDMFKNDPFFNSTERNDPFQEMFNRMQQNMFGQSQQNFMGQQQFPGMQQNFMGQQQNPSNQTSGQVRRKQKKQQPRKPGEPIVEEPSDEEEEASQQQQQQQQQQYQQQQYQQQQYPQQASRNNQVGMLGANDPFQSLFGGGMFGGGMFGGGGMMSSNFGNMMDMNSMSNTGGGGSSYVSTSYYSSGGPNGPQSYKRTQQSRSGPGGLKESQSTYNDYVSGEAEMNLARGIGEKGKAVNKRRDKAGKMSHKEYLRNLNQEEATKFDQDWMQQAQGGLPSGQSGRQQTQPQIQYIKNRDRSFKQKSKSNEPIVEEAD